MFTCVHLPTLDKIDWRIHVEVSCNFLFTIFLSCVLMECQDLCLNSILLSCSLFHVWILFYVWIFYHARTALWIRFLPRLNLLPSATRRTLLIGLNAGSLSLDACLLSKIIKPKMYNAHKMSAKISQLNPVQRLVVRYTFENKIDLATFKFAQLLDSGPIFNNKSEYNAASRLYCNYRRNIHLLWYNTICTVFGSVIVCIKMIFYSTWK